MHKDTSEKEMNPILSQEKARELLADKEFVDALSKAETNEQIIDLFKTRGVELTLNQVQKIVRQGETLNETDLAKISGGINKKAVVGGIGVTTLLAGLGIIAGVCANNEYYKSQQAQNSQRFKNTGTSIAEANQKLQEIQSAIGK